MTAPLVSVIIPCFNQAQFLGEAIESALGQTYPHVDIVVVDDGSADDTAAVACRYPGVRCVRQANRGLAAARNTGIAYSTGEYLVFLDADDRLLPIALATGCEELGARPECAFISGHFRFITLDGRAQPEWVPQPIGPDPYRHLLMSNYIGMVATVMYRSAALRSVGGFRDAPTGAEDYDSYLRITRRCHVGRHDHLVAEYRRHGAAMSDDAARMFVGTLRALRSQLPYVIAHPRYWAAYRRGLMYWRGAYLSAASEQLRRALRIPAQRRKALKALAKVLRVAPLESWAMIRHVVRRDTP